MPTPAERQALLFVAAVAALGVGFRGFRALRADGAPPSAQASLATQLRQVDSAITSGGVARARRPAVPTGERALEADGRAGRSRANRSAARPPDGARPTSSPRTEPDQTAGEVRDDRRVREPVDLDLAGLEELDRLPGIGPALAARIVADREAKGPFGSLEQLQRVKGVGPALAAKLQPYVTFSLSPRLDLTEMPAAGRGRSP